MAPRLNTYTNDYKFGKGRILFNRLVNGIYEGFRPLGNCTEFNINVTSEQFTHVSSEDGLEEIDLQFARSIARTGSIVTDNLSAANLELFLAADVSTIEQSATSVTNEVIGPVTANRTFQLGTALAVGGVRDVSAVTASFVEGDAAAARANTTEYEVGDFYKPAASNNHFYVCTVAGESAAAPPTFTTDGTAFADGTATFIDLGLIAIENTAEADFIVDEDLGLLSVTPAGAIATALAALPDGSTLSLNVDYTRAAVEREQIATSASVSLEGQLKFISSNPRGTQPDVFLPDCTLSPNGDLPLISNDELASCTFAVGINKLDSDTSAIYIDGRPV
jgi:hypothetical protein